MGRFKEHMGFGFAQVAPDKGVEGRLDRARVTTPGLNPLMQCRAQVIRNTGGMLGWRSLGIPESFIPWCPGQVSRLFRSVTQPGTEEFLP